MLDVLEAKSNNLIETAKENGITNFYHETGHDLDLILMKKKEVKNILVLEDGVLTRCQRNAFK